MSKRQIEKERQKVARQLLKRAPGKLCKVDMSSKPHPEWMTRAFRNNRYTVMIDDKALTSKGYGIKAMIQRHDNKPIPNHWSEIQKIKNEIFGKEAVGIEYYPKESQLMDYHQIYWLWIFDEKLIPIPTLLVLLLFS